MQFRALVACVRDPLLAGCCMDCRRCEKPLEETTSSLNAAEPSSSRFCPSCVSSLGLADPVDSTVPASGLAGNGDALSGILKGFATQPTVSKAPEEYDGDLLKAFRAQLAKNSLPWLRRREIGYYTAFIRTTELVLLKPRVAFSNCHGGFETWWDTASYYVASTLIPFAAVSYICCCYGGFSAAAALGSFVLFLLFATSLPILVFWLHVHAAIAHFVYGIVCAQAGSFDATKQVICFAYGAVQLPCLIMIFWQIVYNAVCYEVGAYYLLIRDPFIGPVAYCIWLPICLVVGFKHAHDTSYVKSAMAVLLPVFVPVCFNAIAYLLITAPKFR